MVGKAKEKKSGKRSRKEVSQALSKKTSKYFVKVNAQEEEVLKRELKLREKRELVLLRKRDREELKLRRSKPKGSVSKKVEFAEALGLVKVAIIVKKEKHEEGFTDVTMANNEDAREMSMDLGGGFIQETLPGLVQSEDEDEDEDEISEIEEGEISIVKELVEELVVNDVNGSEIESMRLVLEGSSDEEEREKELEKEVEIEGLSTSLENKKKTFKRKRKHMKGKGNIYSKSGIVEIDEKYHELVGGHNIKVPSLMNGNCQGASKATILFADASQGPELSTRENKYLVEHWDRFRDSVAFPHWIKVGGGEDMKFENEKEFLAYLSGDPESNYMWGDHQQLQITANLYNVKINILSIDGEGNGTIQSQPFVPDSRLDEFALLSAEGTEMRELWLQYSNGNHYDALVKQDHPVLTSAVEGDVNKDKNVAKKVLRTRKRKLAKRIWKIPTTHLTS